MNCTFDPTLFPYEYISPTGETIVEGISVTVPLPNNQPDTQLCVFNTSKCLNSSSCCHETPLVKSLTATTFLPPLITFLVGYLLGLYILRFSNIQKKWGVTGGLGLNATTTDEQKLKQKEKFTNMTERNKCFYKIFIGFFALLYIGSIVALVMEAVIMPASIQESLPPADRSSQLAITSFLAPIEEIFSFLEDTMTVKVGYAVASMNYSELNALLHIGVLGGVGSGLIAFLMTTFIAYYPSTAEAVLNPSHKSNQILIDGGCSLVPTTQELLIHAKTYWMLLTLSWIPKFASKSIFGFFVGAGKFLPFLFASIVQATVPITLWFLLKDVMPPLTALGELSDGRWCCLLLFGDGCVVCGCLEMVC